MRTNLVGRACASVLSLFYFASHVRAGEAQFIELTAEIEVVDWSYMFWTDRENLPRRPTSLFTKWEGPPIRCAVGTNSWMIEGPPLRNASVTHWFTGTNIIKRTVITQELPEAEVKRMSKSGAVAVKSPEVGAVDTRTNESPDGNPGRPVRVIDLMDTGAKVCWLAFCSAPALKGNDSRIALPSDLWKQYLAVAKFTNDIARFEDGLGLPRGITVCTDAGELVMQYQVHHSTNVLGWNFPTEFYLVQYKPLRSRGTNAWEVLLTAKGRVTAIGPGTEPQIPK
jgi:hypothetical protein